ncbi:MAG: hypothetical protein HBSAPP02_24630 [Phycisphaerae bacterium]|nr:MAG: dienelactone hydrolase family protein [Planctomycetia bacterium]GJQ27431.1 MAG: hypothetical protein HBSAPP02_24630 [Phycisphaerae bacterium]
MYQRGSTSAFLLTSLLTCGCGQLSPCPNERLNTSATQPSPQTFAEQPYVGTADAYQFGPLQVVSTAIERCDRGAPVLLRIHAPEDPGHYAVLLFQHGFMVESSAYEGMLRQIASHGFVVVAPQMYQPGLMALFGTPTAFEEAEVASGLVDWMTEHLSAVTGVTARVDRLAIGGHSRGGKVAWLTALKDATRFRAIIGVDPVDGRGGPAGNQPRVAAEPFPFNLPALVIGAGLNGACAPTGDNYVQFYESSQSPAWRIVAKNYAHGDMLDEPAAAASAAFCGTGADRESMRRATAGMMVLFLREALQRGGSPPGDLYVANPPPIEIDAVSK